MITRCTSRFRHAMRRGFSLIEVMMATAILGLGILGLLALFAGTARQQQIASEATDSLLITANAQSIIGPEVGSLEDPFGPDFTGSRPLDDLVPNVWYPMTAEGVGNDERLVGPRVTANADDIFFLADANVPGDEFPLYEGDPQKWLLGPSPGNCGGSFTMQFQGESFEFPGDRLEPCSIPSIQVEIVQYDFMTGESTPVQMRTYTLAFFDNGSAYDASNNIAYYIGPNHGSPLAEVTSTPGNPTPCGQPRYTPAQRPNCDPDDDFIALDLAYDGSTTRATIDRMNIRGLGFANPTWRVGSITVQAPFRFRRTGIVALNDRLNYRTNNEGQRVPQLGYSLLFRRTSTGRTEVMVATYRIRQTEAGSAFVPREDFASVFGGNLSGGSSSSGPLRQVDGVTLGYDQDEGMHYIEINSADAEEFGWIVEPGTVVLVQGDTRAGPTGPVASTTPGSELSTEVVSLEIQDDGSFRGFLERAPRNNGSILLTNLNTPRTGETVWGVQPSVVSQDGSEWRLIPISIEPVFLNEVR